MVSTVAIAGISSRLALLIVEELLKEPGIKLRGSSRSLEKLPPWLRQSNRVSLIQTGPYEIDNLRALVKSSDVVICCYLADNEVMHQGQKHLIDLCEEEGVPRYIASDYTMDFTKLNYGDVEIKDPMKQVKAYIETKSSVKGVHVLTGLFFESYWELIVPYDPETKTLFTWVSADAKYDMTSYRTAAQYVAAVALDESATGVFKFLAQHKSAAEIAEDFESVYGFKPRVKVLGSLNDMKKVTVHPEGFQNPMAAGVYYMLADVWPIHDDTQNDLYPQVKPETFRDFFNNDDRLDLGEDTTGGYRAFFRGPSFQ